MSAPPSLVVAVKHSAGGAWASTTTLELVFIPKRDLLKFAAALAQATQEPVLLKTESDGAVYLVNADDSDPAAGL